MAKADCKHLEFSLSFTKGSGFKTLLCVLPELSDQMTPPLLQTFFQGAASVTLGSVQTFSDFSPMSAARTKQPISQFVGMCHNDPEHAFAARAANDGLIALLSILMPSEDTFSPF